ncbi:alanine dehydrogenase [Spelaeicoccus albus]|uniref:Alanine dehydrogenase n=1 Tax=Spelaeicoccus albus TaxID=1280376 RepID=A0A7Z0IIF6_9MICO|nr:alanine dehydrogenase [Spelaeicoccus albus]NYI68317.1 alanine dehydrogenase [Spelaeicoccus albus]
MKIGVPREVKNNEFRVAITPAGVHELSGRGHNVYIESGAGAGSHITDDAYTAAGATILPDADDVWSTADMLLKVKEPIAEEYHRLRGDQILFTYLHLANDKALTDQLVAKKCTALAYETVQTPDRRLPLLAPMSEVAGRLSTQVGAASLLAPAGGRGLLLGGVPGTGRGNVTVLGAGVAGFNAAQIALGLRANVKILDINVDRLRYLDELYRGELQTIVSNSLTVREAVTEADLVIGSVLIPGAKAPKLVTNELVAQMKPGSVLVDIAIDQGGCFEDSHPTTHQDPTFQVHGSTFYCVANMPGAVPNTSTYGLTNVTLPYVTALADKGLSAALESNESLAKGLNTHGGHITFKGVADAFGAEYVDWKTALAA